MNKIQFSTKLGLEQAVLDGQKTHTRRLVGNRISAQDIADIYCGHIGLLYKASPYKPLSRVAIAQPYSRVYTELCANPEVSFEIRHSYYLAHKDSAGWTNKMFVEAAAMLHFIRINSVKLAYLNEINDDECIKEGVISIVCHVYGFSGVCYSFPGDKKPMGTYLTPRAAFAALYDKINGVGAFDSNPLTFAYDFTLIK